MSSRADQPVPPLDFTASAQVKQANAGAGAGSGSAEGEALPSDRHFTSQDAVLNALAARAASLRLKHKFVSRGGFALHPLVEKRIVGLYGDELYEDNSLIGGEASPPAPKRSKIEEEKLDSPPPLGILSIHRDIKAEDLLRQIEKEKRSKMATVIIIRVSDHPDKPVGEIVSAALNAYAEAKGQHSRRFIVASYTTTDKGKEWIFMNIEKAERIGLAFTKSAAGGLEPLTHDNKDGQHQFSSDGKELLKAAQKEIAIKGPCAAIAELVLESVQLQFPYLPTLRKMLDGLVEKCAFDGVGISATGKSKFKSARAIASGAVQGNTLSLPGTGLVVKVGVAHGQCSLEYDDEDETTDICNYVLLYGLLWGSCFTLNPESSEDVVILDHHGSAVLCWDEASEGELA